MTRTVPVAAAAAVVAICCSPLSVSAQTTENPAQNVVSPGETVSIVDDDGRRIEGRVEAVSGGSIRVAVRRASEDIPMDRIVRIERPDSLKNGALTGLGLGMFFGAVGGLADRQGTGNRGAFVVGSVVGNSVIWTALGTAVDAAWNNKRTLYQRGGGRQARVRPVVGPRTTGAALALTW